MLGLSATGVLVGGLWAWIAPPIHAVVAITRAGERVHEYLGSESQNFFIAPFMLLGLLSVLAVVASALMWQWREHRGPQMVAGLSIGLTTAAAIAAYALLAAGTARDDLGGYPAVDPSSNARTEALETPQAPVS